MQIYSEVESHRAYFAKLNERYGVNNVLLGEECQKQIERTAHVIRHNSHKLAAKRALP